MMKKQTYISYLEDGCGNRIAFERWAYKRVETILSKLKVLYTGSYSFVYKEDIAKAKTVSIYATPDGYNREKYPVVRIPITEITG